LEILLLSMLPMAILSGINALVYSYGNYKQVLLIGLALSVPRTVLYIILVPLYGGMGAAMSYTLGSVIGCIVSIMIAKKIGMMILWKILAIIFIIPTTIAFAVSSLHVNYVIGIIGTIVASYIVFLKVHVVTSSDLQDMMEVLPTRVSAPLNKIITKLKK